mmetsp:Transcript_54167/g.128982  ORF Transcript_54167/g.128982 Transcript_54167/m.128982 type:complete len:460 (-) Transcript_54167:23-1402(-)
MDKKPRFGSNVESSSADEADTDSCSSSKPSTPTPREEQDGRSQFQHLREESTSPNEGADGPQSATENGDRTLDSMDDGWSIVCGALRVDVEELRRKQERIAQKEDEADKQRRGQLDCLSERVFQVEREVREMKELHKEAIDKAGAAFELRKTEAQQDRQTMAKLSHSCEALKQRMSSDNDLFTKQIESLHRWNQEHHHQFSQMRQWVDQMAVHEFQAREAFAQHQQLSSQMAQLRTQLAELKVHALQDRNRSSREGGGFTPRGTPRQNEMTPRGEYAQYPSSATPAESVTPPTGMGTPRVRRGSNASIPSQNPWEWANGPFRRIGLDAGQGAIDENPAFESEAARSTVEDGMQSRPLGFGSNVLGDSLRIAKDVKSGMPSAVEEERRYKVLEEDEEPGLKRSHEHNPSRRPPAKQSSSSSWWRPFSSARSDSKGRSEDGDLAPEIVEVNLYNTGQASGR